jgi:hypothetical protein
MRRVDRSPRWQLTAASERLLEAMKGSMRTKKKQTFAGLGGKARPRKNLQC